MIIIHVANYLTEFQHTSQVFCIFKKTVENESNLSAWLFDI